MIIFNGVYKSYKNKSVLLNVNLTIQSSEFMVLIGSSGCGKTTMLKTINKLNAIDQGELLIDGQSIAAINDTKLRRKIGYVVQDGGLFPHLTIAENISIILSIRGETEQKQNERVDALLRMVNLDPEGYRGLYPSQLSGGQRQRVGVARAFATDPEIILMDEPFSALDPLTRNDLQDEICRLQKNLNKTIIFVTHDMDEAIKLGDRICIIQEGRIVQCDTPEVILKKPANAYVEGFIGKNRLWSNPSFIKASDIMKRRPFQISIERSVIQAIQVMNHNSVDSIMVTNNQKFEGIVWLKDLQSFNDYTIPLKHYISHDFHFVYDDTSLKEILNTVECDVTGIIPVITHQEELVGYLTKSSLLATLSKQYQADEEVYAREGVG